MSRRIWRSGPGGLFNPLRPPIASHTLDTKYGDTNLSPGRGGHPFPSLVIAGASPNSWNDLQPRFLVNLLRDETKQEAMTRIGIKLLPPLRSLLPPKLQQLFPIKTKLKNTLVQLPGSRCNIPHLFKYVSSSPPMILNPEVCPSQLHLVTRGETTD